MEKLNTMPNKMSDQAWTKLINHLLENLTVVEAPVDASPIGQLMEHIERFCNGRVQAKNRDELLLGKPWTDEGRHYFRVADFILIVFHTTSHARSRPSLSMTELVGQCLHFLELMK